MGKKKVEEELFRETHIDEFIVKTDDGDHYIFIELPWYDYPIFSHRYTVDDSGRRSFINRIPQNVEEHMLEEHGGYYKKRLEAVMPEEDEEDDKQVVEELF